MILKGSLSNKLRPSKTSDVRVCKVTSMPKSTIRLLLLLLLVPPTYEVLAPTVTLSPRISMMFFSLCSCFARRRRARCACTKLRA